MNNSLILAPTEFEVRALAVLISNLTHAFTLANKLETCKYEFRSLTGSSLISQITLDYLKWNCQPIGIDNVSAYLNIDKKEHPTLISVEEIKEQINNAYLIPQTIIDQVQIQANLQKSSDLHQKLGEALAENDLQKARLYSRKLADLSLQDGTTSKRVVYNLNKRGTVKRLRAKQEEYSHEKFPTGFGILDELGARPHKREFVGFLGVVGEGKTWWCVEVAKTCIQYGLSCLLLEVELDEARTFNRLVQSVFAAVDRNIYSGNEILVRNFYGEQTFVHGRNVPPAKVITPRTDEEKVDDLVYTYFTDDEFKEWLKLDNTLDPTLEWNDERQKWIKNAAEIELRSTPATFCIDPFKRAKDPQPGDQILHVCHYQNDEIPPVYKEYKPNPAACPRYRFLDEISTAEIERFFEDYDYVVAPNQTYRELDRIEDGKLVFKDTVCCGPQRTFQFRFERINRGELPNERFIEILNEFKKEGFCPKVIIVDHAEVSRDMDSNKPDWLQVDAIGTDFSKIAQKYDAVVYSPSQANRAAQDAKKVGNKHKSRGIGAIMDADVWYNFTRDPSIPNRATVEMGKGRNTGKHNIETCQSYLTGQFCLHSRELQSVAQTKAANKKEMMFAKFEEMQSSSESIMVELALATKKALAVQFNCSKEYVRTTWIEWKEAREAGDCLTS